MHTFCRGPRGKTRDEAALAEHSVLTVAPPPKPNTSVAIIKLGYHSAFLWSY